MPTAKETAASDILSGEPVSALPLASRLKIFGYLGLLLILMGFSAPGGGLIGLPMSFFLKNKLHLKAHEVANFHLISNVPVYVSFLMGFARDMLNPFGMKDRGFIALFSGICAIGYAAFAFAPMNYYSLLVAIFLLHFAFLFISSAQQGLNATVAQQHMMTGEVSTAWNVFSNVPFISALLLGGMLSNMLEGEGANQAVRLLFLIGAAIMLALMAFAIWRPRAVFDNVHYAPREATHPWTDFKRLVRHWPIWPALAIWLFWNFAPGSATPLQYYLQNTLHATDAQWGEWNAIFGASFTPTFLLYGWLCRRVALKHLLFWGTLIAIPQMVPLLFIHSVESALWAAVPIGLMGGVCTAAYMDLLMRSCPHGLQGSTLMFSAAMYAIVTRFGDVLGTQLYDRYGGFTVCVAAITLVYALIVPLLLLVPKALTATADGETMPVPAAEGDPEPA